MDKNVISVDDYTIATVEENDIDLIENALSQSLQQNSWEERTVELNSRILDFKLFKDSNANIGSIKHDDEAIDVLMQDIKTLFGLDEFIRVRSNKPSDSSSAQLSNLISILSQAQAATNLPYPILIQHGPDCNRLYSGVVRKPDMITHYNTIRLRHIFRKHKILSGLTELLREHVKALYDQQVLRSIATDFENMANITAESTYRYQIPNYSAEKDFVRAIELIAVWKNFREDTLRENKEGDLKRMDPSASWKISFDFLPNSGYNEKLLSTLMNETEHLDDLECLTDDMAPRREEFLFYTKPETSDNEFFDSLEKVYYEDYIEEEYKRLLMYKNLHNKQELIHEWWEKHVFHKVQKGNGELLSEISSTLEEIRNENEHTIPTTVCSRLGKVLFFSESGRERCQFAQMRLFAKFVEALEYRYEKCLDVYHYASKEPASYFKSLSDYLCNIQRCIELRRTEFKKLDNLVSFGEDEFHDAIEHNDHESIMSNPHSYAIGCILKLGAANYKNVREWLRQDLMKQAVINFAHKWPVHFPTDSLKETVSSVHKALLSLSYDDYLDAFRVIKKRERHLDMYISAFNALIEPWNKQFPKETITNDNLEIHNLVNDIIIHHNRQSSCIAFDGVNLPEEGNTLPVKIARYLKEVIATQLKPDEEGFTKKQFYIRWKTESSGIKGKMMYHRLYANIQSDKVVLGSVITRDCTFF
ncbi:unnamed protein product [Auanema sp. JU1783]|nr:unnamed protein product [Auanema sp. JU1783]